MNTFELYDFLHREQGCNSTLMLRNAAFDELLLDIENSDGEVKLVQESGYLTFHYTFPGFRFEIFTNEGEPFAAILRALQTVGIVRGEGRGVVLEFLIWSL